MIMVTGSIIAKADALDKLLALSLAHVRRSRTEPGCVAHAVHQDAENPLRLVFLEEWTDRAALAAHFAVPASRDFVQAVRPLAEAPPVIHIFEATHVQM
ncbi:MAG: antibiotic biosynthesis monooxygenase [Acidobacteria bacterium]|nr:antibiotic biosynthesis monooxygenase [Acidobacteriota bacterium]